METSGQMPIPIIGLWWHNEKGASVFFLLQKTIFLFVMSSAFRISWEIQYLQYEGFKKMVFFESATASLAAYPSNLSFLYGWADYEVDDDDNNNKDQENINDNNTDNNEEDNTENHKNIEL